jgi:hypothetical protein
MPEIHPPDCYVRIKHIEGEVELIQKEMGRPRDRRSAPMVRGAAPREVYFEALSFFRKADRLCHELTGDQLASVPHAPPISEIKPRHVLAVLEAGQRELAEVKAKLGITEKAPDPAREDSRTPSDVFGAVVGVSRQLNLLLERPFAPGDVYQLLSLGVAYAGRLLAHAGDASPIAAMPALERRKRPADVYDRLLGAVERLRAIVVRSGLTMLEQPLSRSGEEDTLPSDCYDIASLVLAEVAFLHAHIADANPPYPFEANVPGRKLPANCYQIAGLLDQQLGQLDRFTAQKPNWLKRA